MSTIEIVAPPLYPKQHEAIFDPARHCFVEASTKSGKTVGCIVWQFAQACHHVGHHWWVAPIYRQAKIAFTRAKDLVPAQLYQANESNLILNLVNGSVWTFRSGENPDNLYGEDVFSAVVDEASRCKEGVWDALRSTLTATRGPTRCIGNVHGRKNWFYRKCRQAEQGQQGYAFHRLDAWDAVEGGVLDAAEIEEAKADLPDHVFRELYLALASETGANPFGARNIDACTVPAEDWFPRDGDAVVWGLDLAKHVDWTVVVGLDDEGNVCAMHRFQRSWRDTIAFVRSVVGERPCLVDSTGVGDPVLEELQEGGRTNFEGFKFTAPSKQQLMEGLAVDIQRHEVTFPEGPLTRELQEFEYQHRRGGGVRYSAPEGYHDDCVCALALARAKWRTNVETVWWT